MMRRKLIPVVSVLILIAASWSIYTAISPRTNVTETRARLVYKYGDKDIDVQLSAGESELLRTILDGKRLHSGVITGEPSCGFTGDVSIRFDGQVFCVANDSCAVIALEGKYLDIPETDRKTIDRVFEKYGGSFPCI